MRHYSLRFSLIPSADFEKRMRALLDFCQEALIDDVMFFVSAEEVNTGHITLEEAKKYIDVILRAKEILKERGITISLNPWCTFSHYDGGRKLKAEQNFRVMVGADGTKAERVVCPLCENWRKYFVQLYSFYVETLQPEILWFEDDFRFSNHSPVDYGCFCDEHMELFNAAAETSYDRETFVKKIFTDEKIRKAYLDVQRFTLKDMLLYSMKNIKGQNRFGLMTGGAGLNEGRQYRDIFGILSDGRKKPYNRICLNSYRQRGMQEYAWDFNEASMFTRKITNDYAHCVSEMENFPHSMYTKSAKYLKYQLLTSAPLCLKGDTLSIFEFNGNGIVNGKAYASVLKSVKGYLGRLNEIGVSPENMVGVKVLINENSVYTVKNPKDFGFNISDGWLFAYLEQIGIACTYSFNINVKGEVVAVSGQVLRNFTREQIIVLFKNNFVIITGDNIEVLKDMGLLYLIGAENYEIFEEGQGKHSMEQDATGAEIMGVDCLRATAQFFCGDYYNIRYNATAEKTVHTYMLNYNEEKVGDAIVSVGNTLVFPYKNINFYRYIPISLICPLRAYAVKEALRNNAVNSKALYFIQEENVCIYAFDKGDKVYMICVNFAEDDYPQLHIQSPYVFDDLKIFTPDNDMVRTVANVCENGSYTVNQILKGQESYVLIGKKRKE